MPKTPVPAWSMRIPAIVSGKLFHYYFIRLKLFLYQIFICFRHTVKELGTVTIELIKATGTCQMTPNDSFALRDVSESGRSVGEKVIFFSILFRLAILLFQQKNTFSVDGIFKM